MNCKYNVYCKLMKSNPKCGKAAADYFAKCVFDNDVEIEEKEDSGDGSGSGSGSEEEDSYIKCMLEGKKEAMKKNR